MNEALIIFSLLLICSVFFSRISDKFGIPALLIFLSVGMIAGSDGLVGIYFHNQNFARNIGTIALIFILFSGGLDTKFSDIRPVIKDGLLLATIGVFITTIIFGFVAYYVLKAFGLKALLMHCFMIGAILSSTDAAAVFALLKSSGIKLKKRIKSLLELESGSNDPMAIFLTFSIIEMVSIGANADLSISDLLFKLIYQFSFGSLLGYIFGALLPIVFNKVKFGFWGLYPVFSIAWVLLLFAFAEKIGANGYIAVYVAGIVANKKDFVHKRNIVGFHDGVAWMMQIIIFVTLGLLVFPKDIPSMAGYSLINGLLLMFIARPLSVFISLAFSKYTIKEKLFVSWVGLRGVVPIILATYPILNGIAYAQEIFNMVFLLVFMSVLVQGMSLSRVAKYFGVIEKSGDENTQASPIFYSNIKKIIVSESSFAFDRPLVELELPDDFLVLLVNRAGEYIKPSGSFVFMANDLLLVVCDDENKFKNIQTSLFSKI